MTTENAGVRVPLLRVSRSLVRSRSSRAKLFAATRQRSVCEIERVADLQAPKPPRIVAALVGLASHRGFGLSFGRSIIALRGEDVQDSPKRPVLHNPYTTPAAKEGGLNEQTDSRGCMGGRGHGGFSG